jgi:hypothetical protein
VAERVWRGPGKIPGEGLVQDSRADIFQDDKVESESGHETRSS